MSQALASLNGNVAVRVEEADVRRRAVAFFNVAAELERLLLPVFISSSEDKNITLLGGCALRQSIAVPALTEGVAEAVLAIHEPGLSITQRLTRREVFIANWEIAVKSHKRRGR